VIIATLGGIGAAIPLIVYFPPEDLAAEHAAATTPFARAVTSPALNVATAAVTCVFASWMLGAVAFWLLASRPVNASLIPRSERNILLIGLRVMLFLLMLLCDTLRSLHTLVDAGVLGWTMVLVRPAIVLVVVVRTVVYWVRAPRGDVAAGV
jgi:hypothetical protein